MARENVVETGRGLRNPAISAKPSEKSKTISFFLGRKFLEKLFVDHKKTQVKKTVYPA